ncbi:hypothetical protein FDI24_gp207 [Acidovorax phage ACP17]|uniref:Uncharacterized protein n=1 Tax=Acidovorax phage ACP17 TaxID=2010329 RepID=A0A218M374_9CAUD|nr:hypothetical protein FDI24_gp207 [Acidovorax phage ACP17]ASD50488.1 hypothetical protein [Acidovorax phage ACP17]
MTLERWHDAKDSDDLFVQIFYLNLITRMQVKAMEPDEIVLWFLKDLNCAIRPLLDSKPGKKQEEELRAWEESMIPWRRQIVLAHNERIRLCIEDRKNGRLR